MNKTDLHRQSGLFVGGTGFGFQEANELFRQ